MTKLAECIESMIPRRGALLTSGDNPDWHAANGREVAEQIGRLSRLVIDAADALKRQGGLQ